MPDFSLVELIPLIVIAFTAGLVDAAVGGGGLIQLPGLFAVLPGANATAMLGSNKFSSVFGTAVAAWRYGRQIDIAWRLVLPTAITAFVFSFIGAAVISQLPKTMLQPLVLVLLVVILIYTLAKKDFGSLHRPSQIGRREMGMALLMGAAIGFYDGAFGPGTGSFLIFLFIRFFGFDFLRANSATKIVNLSTNLAALCFFIPHGDVLFYYAIPMACANMLGAVFGAKLALKGGTVLIRKLFIVLVLALISKLAWATFA